MGYWQVDQELKLLNQEFFNQVLCLFIEDERTVQTGFIHRETPFIVEMIQRMQIQFKMAKSDY